MDDLFPWELYSKMFVREYGCVGECAEIFSVCASCLHRNLCIGKYTYIKRKSLCFKMYIYCFVFTIDVTYYSKCRNLQKQNKADLE